MVGVAAGSWHRQLARVSDALPTGFASPTREANDTRRHPRGAHAAFGNARAVGSASETRASRQPGRQLRKPSQLEFSTYFHLTQPAAMIQLAALPEAARDVTSLHGQAETAVISAVLWLKLAVETVGAIIIALGILSAGWLLVKAVAKQETADFTAIRLTLARYLALALEFQLGADILSTAIAPSWEQIGKLGAIAVIRTALNFFLSREMREERHQAPPEQEVVNRADG